MLLSSAAVSLALLPGALDEVLARYLATFKVA